MHRPSPNPRSQLRHLLPLRITSSNLLSSNKENQPPLNNYQAPGQANQSTAKVSQPNIFQNKPVNLSNGPLQETKPNHSSACKTGNSSENRNSNIQWTKSTLSPQTVLNHTQKSQNQTHSIPKPNSQNSIALTESLLKMSLDNQANIICKESPVKQKLKSQPLQVDMLGTIQKENILSLETQKLTFQQLWIMNVLSTNLVIKKYIQSRQIIPDTLPVAPLNSTPEQLIYVHPWSLHNPNRLKQTKISELSQAKNNLNEMNYNLLKFYNIRVQKEELRRASENSKFPKMLEGPEEFKWGVLTQRTPLINVNWQRKIQEILQEESWSVNMSELENQVNELSQIQKLIKESQVNDEEIQQKWKDNAILLEKNKIWIQEQLRKPQQKRFSLSPYNQKQYRTSSSKFSPSTNSTEKRKYRLYRFEPEVTEFKIGEHEKSFLKKYEITIDCYELPAWKWLLYRIKNLLRTKYNGKLTMESYEGQFKSQDKIIEDWLKKNNHIERIFTSGFSDSILFESSKEKGENHASDFEGLIILPLHLQLPQGYFYHYAFYTSGSAKSLVIENEHVSIRYIQNVDFGMRKEETRDLRKKLRLERNSVWIGDNVLKEDAVIIFKKPSSQEVNILRNDSESFELKISEAKEREFHMVRNYQPKIKQKPEQVIRKLEWKHIPKTPMKIEHTFMMFMAKILVLGVILDITLAVFV